MCACIERRDSVASAGESDHQPEAQDSTVNHARTLCYIDGFEPANDGEQIAMMDSAYALLAREGRIAPLASTTDRAEK
jgi:hypothetical protein